MTTTMNMEKAIQFYTQSAVSAQDNSKASTLFKLGLLYCNGEGRIQADAKKAVDYWTRAAEQGDQRASFNVGVIYHKGQGNIEANVEEAVRWYNKANIAEAMHNLGVIYHHGEGNCAVDEEKAVGCYESAVKEGNHVRAMYNLGIIYQFGLGGICADTEKATKWFKRAIEIGKDRDAMYQMGLIYDTAQAYMEAVKYFELAAEAGRLNANFMLGLIFHQGRGTIIPVDGEKASYYYELAANDGLVNAMFNLAVVQEFGIDGKAMNPENAFNNYERAASHGDTKSMFSLGCIFESGLCNQKVNIEAAKQYFEDAAKLGSIMAMFRLGVIYGEDSEKMGESVKWFEAAANLGNISANFNLGVIYEEGKYSIKPDINQAMRYFGDAAKPLDRSELSEHDHWISNYSLYHIGELWFEGKGGAMDVEKAQKAFEQTIDQGFYLGCVGMSTLKENRIEKVKLLMTAAEHGVREAWEKLKPFAEDPYLLEHWTIQNKASLRELILSSEVTATIPYCSHVNNCHVCQQQCSLAIFSGSNRTQSQIPSTHIDGNLIDISRQGFGKGGQAQVFRAVIAATGELSAKHVVLKRYQKLGSHVALHNELSHLQFMRGNSFVVESFGHTLVGSDIYVVMEAAPHGDLETFLRDHKSIASNISLALRWMHEIASGLYHLHRFFILHGDVKPANVLVYEGLHVKLGDFGGSKEGKFSFPRDIDINTQAITCFATDDNGLKTENVSITDNATGVKGTRRYMAPEIRNGKVPTVASDMFSFGITCAEILLGESPPYPGFKAFVERLLPNAFPPALIDMVRKCTDVKRDNRLLASQCVEILESLIKGEFFCNEDEIGRLEGSLVIKAK